jgi:KDO2-lipid IV(A) lauroyltransferase
MVGLVRGPVFALGEASAPSARAIWGALARTRRSAPARSSHHAGESPGCLSRDAEAEVRALALKAWDNLGRTPGNTPISAPCSISTPSAGRRPDGGRWDRRFPGAEGRRPAGPHLLRPPRQLGAARDLRRPLRPRRHGRVPRAERSGRRPRPARDPQPDHGQPRGGAPGRGLRHAGGAGAGGHLGMLIDQHFTRGVIVNFMGRPALVNPILGKFARRFDCPVHGVRVIRLPGHRFRCSSPRPSTCPAIPTGRSTCRAPCRP